MEKIAVLEFLETTTQQVFFEQLFQLYHNKQWTNLVLEYNLFRIAILNTNICSKRAAKAKENSQNSLWKIPSFLKISFGTFLTSRHETCLCFGQIPSALATSLNLLRILYSAPVAHACADKWVMIFWLCKLKKKSSLFYSLIFMPNIQWKQHYSTWNEITPLRTR